MVPDDKDELVEDQEIWVEVFRNGEQLIIDDSSC